MKILEHLSSIELERCIYSDLQNLPKFDNGTNLNRIKFLAFKMSAELNKEKNFLQFNLAKTETTDRTQGLWALTVEKLQELLVQKRAKLQFRNFKTMNKEELIQILSDLYLIEDMENKNES